MLRTLKLENYCCHRELEAEFKAGINCIVGLNGSGKSSVVSALYAALTGVHDHPDGASGAIRQGADSAKIEAVFDDFTVTRTIGEKNKHLLVIGEEKWTAAKEIEQQLAHRFGLVRGILDRFMFIRQGRFTEIVTLTSSERLKMLAYLSSVEYFEVLWKKLADEMKMHEGQLNAGPTFDEHTVRAKVEELEAKLEENKAAAAAHQLELDPLLEKKAEYEEAVNLGRKLEAAFESERNNREELKRLTDRKTSLEGELAVLTIGYDAMEAEVKSLRLNAKEELDCKTFDEYDRRKPQYDAKREELKAASDALVGYDEASTLSDIQALELEESKLSERAAKLQMQLRQANVSNKEEPCEVCGAPPEAQFKGNPTVISGTLQRTNTELAKIRNQIGEARNLMRVQSQNAARVATLTAELKSIDLDAAEANRGRVTELKARAEKYRTEAEKLSGLKSQIAIADAGLKSTISLLESID